MSVVTVRPDETKQSGGASWTLVDSTKHGATSDDSDATYVQGESTGAAEMHLGFPQPTIPAGAEVTGISWRVRTRKVNGDWVWLNTYVFNDTTNEKLTTTQATKITWATVTTHGVGGAIRDGVLGDLAMSFMRLSGQNGTDARVMEAYIDTTYVDQPTLTVEDPIEGSTITDTTNPEVTWAGTLDADGGAQARFQAKIFDDATFLGGGFDPDTSTPFEDSGTVQSAAEIWTPAEPQPDDTYRAYVRIAQDLVTGITHWSEWDFNEYEVSVAKPGVPTMTLTAEDSVARVKIDLDDTAGGTTTDAFYVQTSEDSGTSWLNLRTEEDGGRVLPSGGSATVYHREGPNGGTITYRARASHDYTTSGTAFSIEAFSDWTATDTELWSSDDFWIKHPTKPSLNMITAWRSQPGHERPGRQGIFQALGSEDAIVITDTRAPAGGELVLRSDTEAVQGSLDALLDEADPVLMQAPAAVNWPDRWLAVTAHRRDRAEDADRHAHVFDGLSWVEVPRPSGNLEE